MTTAQTKRRRRIMRAFTIDEISAVDRPAQGHARMALMKRHDPQQERDDDMHHHFHKITRDQPRGYSSLEDAIEAIRKAEGCSGTDAMEMAASRHPDLVRTYNRQGLAAIAKAAADAAPRPVAKAIRDFDDLVNQIAKRDGCPKHIAMQKAAVEHPDEFLGYQEA